MRGLCGREGGLVGTKQTRYLVLGTPFLLNEMIAGRVPELWRGLHSLWLASWSPGTPGWGSRLMCKACLVRGRGRRRRRWGGGQEGSQGEAARGERALGAFMVAGGKADCGGTEAGGLVRESACWLLMASTFFVK